MNTGAMLRFSKPAQKKPGAKEDAPGLSSIGELGRSPSSMGLEDVRARLVSVASTKQEVTTRVMVQRGQLQSIEGLVFELIGQVDRFKG